MNQSAREENVCLVENEKERLFSPMATASE